jgi:hypothetical protein
MKTGHWFKFMLILLLMIPVANCGPGSGEVKVDIENILSKPKAYVGSEQCQFCHLEHYDSWKTTLHSRTIQDVTQNQDALIAEIDPEAILADLKKQQIDLKVPADQIYIPKVEEIKYTIGMQWKQGFLIEKKRRALCGPD